MGITAGQSFIAKVGEALSQTPAYTGRINSLSATGLPAVTFLGVAFYG